MQTLNDSWVVNLKTSERYSELPSAAENLSHRPHCACHPEEYIEYLILQIFCIWRMNSKKKTFHAILFSEKDIFQTAVNNLFFPLSSKS